MTSATPDLQLPSQPMLVLIMPTHKGMAHVEWTWVPGSLPGWLTCLKMTVTHLGTNRAQRRVTALIETSAVPLS